jgi:hypothetical protein
MRYVYSRRGELPAFHRIAPPPVMDLANIEPVLEQMGERSHAEADPAALLAIPPPIDLGPDASPVEFRTAYRAMLICW